MIQANELRIGNLVNTKHGIQVIDAIGTLDCSSILPPCKFSLRHFNYEDVEHITLTEEWLLKLGFKQDERNRWRDSTVNFDLFYLYGTKDFYAVNVMPVIKSVHQLQNLFYSLTGEELTIKQLSNE